MYRTKDQRKNKERKDRFCLFKVFVRHAFQEIQRASFGDDKHFSYFFAFVEKQFFLCSCSIYEHVAWQLISFISCLQVTGTLRRRRQRARWSPCCTLSLEFPWCYSVCRTWAQYWQEPSSSPIHTHAATHARRIATTNSRNSQSIRNIVTTTTSATSLRSKEVRTEPIHALAPLMRRPKPSRSSRRRWPRQWSRGTQFRVSTCRR